MKIFEIGTGYTSVPARMGAATEIVVAELTTSMRKLGEDVTIVDIKDKNRMPTRLLSRRHTCPSSSVRQTPS